MTLDERLRVVCDAFAAEVLSAVSPGTASKITLDVWVGGPFKVGVTEKSDPSLIAFATVDADGTPEEVAKRVEDAVLDKKPWLVS